MAGQNYLISGQQIIVVRRSGCLRQLEEQLEACGDLPILAVTHMLPVEDFCVPETPGGLKLGIF